MYMKMAMAPAATFQVLGLLMHTIIPGLWAWWGSSNPVFVYVRQALYQLGYILSFTIHFLE